MLLVGTVALYFGCFGKDGKVAVTRNLVMVVGTHWAGIKINRNLRGNMPKAVQF